MPVYVRVMFAATFGMVVTYEVVNSKDYEHVVKQLLLLFLPAYTCIIWMTSVSKWRARLLLPSHRLPLPPLPVHRAPSVL